MTASIYSLVIGLFRFSISSCSSFGIFGFPEMHPFLLDCILYWHIAAHNKFLKSFVFPWYWCDLFFIHDFINLSLFSLLFNKAG